MPRFMSSDGFKAAARVAGAAGRRGTRGVSASCSLETVLEEAGGAAVGGYTSPSDDAGCSLASEEEVKRSLD